MNDQSQQPTERRNRRYQHEHGACDHCGKICNVEVEYATAINSVTKQQEEIVVRAICPECAKN